MNTLQAWLEYNDVQMGSTRRIDILEKVLRIDQVLLTKKDSQTFVIRSLTENNTIFVNDRHVSEAELTNFDRIRIGKAQLVFRAAYLPEPSDVLQNEPPVETPTSHFLKQSIRPGQIRSDVPVFEFSKTWPIHLLNLLLIGLQTMFNRGPAAFIFSGLFLLSCALALGTTAALTKSSTRAMRFAFCISPLVLALEGIFSYWAAQTHPVTTQYFLGALVPAGLLWIFTRLLSHEADLRLTAATIVPAGVVFAVLMFFTV